MTWFTQAIGQSPVSLLLRRIMTINYYKSVNNEASVHARDRARCVYVCLCKKYNGYLSLLSYMSNCLYCIVSLCLLHPILYFHQLIKSKPTLNFTFITTNSLLLVFSMLILGLNGLQLFVGFFWPCFVLEKKQPAC